MQTIPRFGNCGRDLRTAPSTTAGTLRTRSFRIHCRCVADCSGVEQLQCSSPDGQSDRHKRGRTVYQGEHTVNDSLSAGQFVMNVLRPSSFSVYFLAVPASPPPRFATCLLFINVSGFSFWEISVVTLSPSIVKMSSKSVM